MLEFTLMDAMRTASGSRQSFRDAEGQGTIVFDLARLQQAGPELFDPASYGANAQPVSCQGGRGAAWYVHGEFGDGVLRHYRRGGWMARVNKQSYLWRGENEVRSLSEFRLLEELHADGLPVPAPIAAIYRRHGLGYEAAIIVERLPDARSFLSAVRADGAAAPWSDAGTAIGRCHRHRAHHADLNANNLLIGQGNDLLLIDWDKGRIEAASGRWCQRVLDRLQRSLVKECGDSSGIDIEAGMTRLRAAHDLALAP